MVDQKKVWVQTWLRHEIGVHEHLLKQHQALADDEGVSELQRETGRIMASARAALLDSLEEELE